MLESARWAFRSMYWYQVTPVYYAQSQSTGSMLNTHGRFSVFFCHNQVQPLSRVDSTLLKARTIVSPTSRELYPLHERVSNSTCVVSIDLQNLVSEAALVVNLFAFK